MHNTVVTATSKLKSIYNGIVLLGGGLLPNYLWSVYQPDVNQ